MIFLSVTFFCFSCNKESAVKNDKIPGDYEEMFAALNLQFNVTYNYTEMINNNLSGNKGTVKFLLADTSMIETYKSNITKDYFRLDSFKAYSSKFESLGRNKYNVNNSLFINNAWQNISFVNGVRMVSFGTTNNGSYYFYQYLLFE